jgi:hypothetical protein
MGKIISHEEAADIVGKHFGNVQDKLLNVLQLQQNKASVHSDALLNASINQRISELKPVPFTSAIDLSENKKHLKYACNSFAGIGFYFSYCSKNTEFRHKATY